MGTNEISTSPVGQLKQKSCSQCGVLFTCGPTEDKGTCWCEELPRVPVIAPDQDCLCPACLGGAIAANTEAVVGSTVANPSVPSISEASPPSLVEGDDYYWEGPAMVFTARYLLRRGYCCESGCRHCPYRKKGKKS